MDEQLPPSVDAPTPGPSSSSPKRLHRSSSNKMLMGVCGGLGEHFDIDPTILRLIFAIGVVLGGTTIVLYIVLAIVMPSDAGMVMEPRDAAKHTVDEAVEDLKSASDKLVAKVKEFTGRLG
ncbi:MAG: PspC domain-containing protein [Thermomicrobiales bacterium]|nr:PspC domain-containing protein [Thermomicrobiales bacterium]